MRFSLLFCPFLCVAVLQTSTLIAQSDSDFVSIPLRPESFRTSGKNWTVAGNATGDFMKENDLKAIRGEGVLVNNPTAAAREHLVTTGEYGDVEIEVDVMMAKNSNSGIYLQGRYEIQLYDSWAKKDINFSDIGGIYSRWTDARQNYEGTSPVMNVAKAPGLWQHLDIKFRAPRFSASGEKISNARFEEVYLNGVLVQQEASVTGPTRSSLFEDEKATGPIMIQGDHGPVAIRNLRIRKAWRAGPKATDEMYWQPGSAYWEAVNPVVVNPTIKPAFIKTFLMYGDKKLTHVLSVGHPSQIHFSYDLKEGAMFQVWRGQFMDLSMAWIDRGEMQLSRPMGSVLVLSDGPAVAALPDATSTWPDSIAFDDMNNKGYTLDHDRTPTFSYTTSGMDLLDRIHALPDGSGIERTISCSNASANSYCRLVKAKTIDKISETMYAIDDRRYYVQVPVKSKIIVRNTASGQEIIAKLNPEQPVAYSIIW